MPSQAAYSSNNVRERAMCSGVTAWQIFMRVVRLPKAKVSEENPPPRALDLSPRESAGSSPSNRRVRHWLFR